MTAVDWPAFALVLVCSLVAATATVALFAVGVRLLSTPPAGTAVEGEPDPDDQDEDDPATPAVARPVWATVAGSALLALAAAVAAAGVILIVVRP